VKGIAIFLMLTALGAAGCLTAPLPSKPEAPKPPVAEGPPASPQLPQPPPAPPVVLAEQVTEANAAEKAEELRRELAYAAAQPVTTQTTVSAKP
jgi:hypothetical protein